MGLIAYDRLEGLLASAVSAGNAVMLSPMRWRWDLASHCDSPINFELFGRPAQWTNDALIKRGVAPRMVRKLISTGLIRPDRALDGFRYDPGSDHPLLLELIVPCRRCGPCLRRRAWQWRMKALEEMRAASRTWFLTLTLSPDQHFRVLSVARNACHERSTRFEELSEADQFAARVAACTPDITRYVKRVRKESGAPLRYLLVAERHESGLPHFHALLHEVSAAMPVRKRTLQGQWLLGFSQVKLTTDEAAAWYVCKYLTKELATRVRSSLRYGKTTSVDRRPVAVKLDPHTNTISGVALVGSALSMEER